MKTDGAGNLSFETIFSNIDLAGDTGTDTYNTNETLTFAKLVLVCRRRLLIIR